MAELDIYGRSFERPDTTGMMFPVQCIRCGNVHDKANVTVISRYTDCSVWECPGCHTHVDDRPVGWGGSVKRLDRG